MRFELFPIESRKMAKVKRCRILRNYLRMHPETHNQNYWGQKNHCGTTLCAAGATIMLFGIPHRWVLEPSSDYSFRLIAGEYEDSDMSSYQVQHLAAQVLGLTNYESDKLFLTTDNETALAYLDKLCGKN